MTKRMTVSLLLFPTILVLLLLFVGGVLMGLMQSLGYMPLIDLNDFNLDAYKGLFSDRQFLVSLGLTLWVSIGSTLFTLVLAIVTALAFRRTFAGKRVINFLYQFPITIPHIVITIGAMLLLAQNGIFARFAHSFGWITNQSQFPVLVYDKFGLGIIYVYLWKQIPFVGVIVLSILQSVGNDFEELARSLGANKWQTFRHVLLPIIIPGILPASIICFSFTFGSYEVPFLLGRPYPAMISVLAMRLYQDVDLNARPQAMATAIFMAVFISILVVFYKRLLNKVSGRM
ncbi:MAG: ABC transporter permease subunit [Rectinemataceae bacterium]|jgi:putative spermidine/putrescine transport system permease protein